MKGGRRGGCHAATLQSIVLPSTGSHTIKALIVHKAHTHRHVAAPPSLDGVALSGGACLPLFINIVQKLAWVAFNVWRIAGVRSLRRSREEEMTGHPTPKRHVLARLQLPIFTKGVLARAMLSHFLVDCNRS